MFVAVGVLAVRAVRVAVDLLFQGGVADRDHFDVEAQRQPRQRVVDVDVDLVALDPRDTQLDLLAVFILYREGHALLVCAGHGPGDHREDLRLREGPQRREAGTGEAGTEARLGPEKRYERNRKGEPSRGSLSFFRPLNP